MDADVASTDWGLSAAGRQAAAELAEALGEFNADAVMTSPERKARKTAEIIADRKGAPVGIEHDLREHERRSTGFLPRSEFEEGIRRLLRSPAELVFGDETADAVFLRFSTVLARVQAGTPQHDVLAVTHGTALSIFVGRTLGLDPLALWRSLTTPMAVIISGRRMEVIAPSAAILR
jgi:uncharacterized phosphatase